MIKRIVRLTFRPDAVEIFLTEVFEPSKSLIRAFPGCRHMELLRQAGRPDVMFTLSVWESEAALDAYRESELFRSTWARTKLGFAEKPEAWTVEVLDAPEGNVTL
jgi:heme-degrading monooxygenase HmoA